MKKTITQTTLPLNQIVNGDVLSVLKTFPSNSIDCVITSPPYWQLRDYHWKGQWGLEKTFAEYLENLWLLMTEIKRVLKPSGTVWINLGDTYARGNKGKDGINQNLHRSIKEHIVPKTKPDYGNLNKCQLLIPHRFAIGCIERGWIMRNDIIWAKTNAMPESVRDRFSKKHEYIFFMTKSENYFFDLDSVREAHLQSSIKRMKYKWNGHRVKGSAHENMNIKYMCHPKGKNPGDVSDFWKISTKSNHDKHYATFNTDLITKPILAGCPEGGVVLDPFCGTGTTGIKAIELNRYFIGIDGKKEYCEMAKKKIKEVLSKNKPASVKSIIEKLQQLNLKTAA